MIPWTFLLVLVPTLCYLGAGGLYLAKGNHPLAMTYFGYAFANVGLLWLDRLS